MDNQQAKIQDIIWLAGLLDGEGSFFMSRGYHNRDGDKRKPAKNGGYYPTVKITMCHEPTIIKVRQILDTLVVGHYGIDHAIAKGNRKDSWGTKVTGMRRCLTLFSHIEPFCVTKAEQLRLLKEYCLSRLNHSHLDPLTKRETEIIDIFRNPDSPQRLNAHKWFGNQITNGIVQPS